MAVVVYALFLNGCSANFLCPSVTQWNMTNHQPFLKQAWECWSYFINTLKKCFTKNCTWVVWQPLGQIHQKVGLALPSLGGDVLPIINFQLYVLNYNSAQLYQALKDKILYLIFWKEIQCCCFFFTFLSFFREKVVCFVFILIQSLKS